MNLVHNMSITHSPTSPNSSNNNNNNNNNNNSTNSKLLSNHHSQNFKNHESAISTLLQAASTTYNQYACIRCRKLKKKCSKELPKCSNCDKQQECCEYVERKNKRKSSITHIKSNKKFKSDQNESDDNSIPIKNLNLNSNSPDHNINNNIPNITITSINNNNNNNNNNNIHSERRHTTTTKLESILTSPKSSIISLPPIRSRSTSTNQYSKLNGPLPSLSSYSLQQNNINNNNNNNNTIGNNLSNFLDQSSLPSVPRQLFISNSIPTNFNHAYSNSLTTSSLPDPSALINNKPRRGSKASIHSLSPKNRESTFLAPSSQIFSNEQFKIPDSIQSHILFNNITPNGIEFDLLILIINRIGFIDENIFKNFIINNENDISFNKSLTIILKLIIFLDPKIISKSLNNFKQNNFNWNSTYASSEDYFSSIEFLLVYTCAILISNYQNNITNSNYHKFTFTMAYKLLKRETYSITNIQILRLTVLFLFIAYLSGSNSDNIWFIQSILSKYSMKWSLNKNLKKMNINNVTLSELEYSNRLFWCIFITDSFISSTFGQQPNFKLNDIDVPLPIAITKDEEIRIGIQHILINMSKIQTRIISELYVVMAREETNSDSERFAILSSLRQEADIWYNDCRITLSKLSDLKNLKLDKVDNNIELIKCDLNLQNLAAWISQEYYYTLTQLFKPSNLFPKPDIPNFRVISNTSYQNTVLLHDLITKKIIMPSTILFYRYANNTLAVLISLYKGMFTIDECHILFKNMIEIWKFGTDLKIDNICEKCFNKINEILNVINPSFELTAKENYKKRNKHQVKNINLDDSDDASDGEYDDILNKFRPNDDIAKIVLKLMQQFGEIMEQSGLVVSIDIDYLKNSVSLE